MDYYFPKDFEKKMDFFNKTKFTKELKQEVLEKVENKLKEFSYDKYFYDYYKKENFNKAEPNYSWGVFYYYWMNCYLRDTILAVWHGTYTDSIKTLDDRKASKEADNMRTAFEKWLKEKFK